MKMKFLSSVLGFSENEASSIGNENSCLIYLQNSKILVRVKKVNYKASQKICQGETKVAC